MIGPKHLPTVNEKVLFEMDYSKHRQKLEQIKSIDRKKKNLDPDIEIRKKNSQMRVQNFRFQHLEKNLAIDRDNQLLLGRLVEISKQKKPKLFPVKSEANIPKTLNAPYRKKELERIAYENEALARRLLTQNSQLNMKKFDNDYERHRKLLKHVQKLSPSPKSRAKLPPLMPETTKSSVKKIELPQRNKSAEQKKRSESQPAEKIEDLSHKKTLDLDKKETAKTDQKVVETGKESTNQHQNPSLKLDDGASSQRKTETVPKTETQNNANSNTMNNASMNNVAANNQANNGSTDKIAQNPQSNQNVQSSENITKSTENKPEANNNNPATNNDVQVNNTQSNTISPEKKSDPTQNSKTEINKSSTDDNQIKEEIASDNKKA